MTQDTKNIAFSVIKTTHFHPELNLLSSTTSLLLATHIHEMWDEEKKKNTHTQWAMDRLFTQKFKWNFFYSNKLMTNFSFYLCNNLFRFFPSAVLNQVCGNSSCNESYMCILRTVCNNDDLSCAFAHKHTIYTNERVCLWLCVLLVWTVTYGWHNFFDLVISMRQMNEWTTQIIILSVCNRWRYGRIA